MLNDHVPAQLATSRCCTHNDLPECLFKCFATSTLLQIVRPSATAVLSVSNKLLHANATTEGFCCVL